MTKKIKILIAEDDFLTQEMINFLFLKIGIEYKLVSNGQEALKEFHENKYSLILMDLYMPVMNGIEAINKIRELEQANNLKPISIVLLSADDEENIGEQISPEKIELILQKPLTKEKIKNILSLIHN